MLVNLSQYTDHSPALPVVFNLNFLYILLLPISSNQYSMLRLSFFFCFVLIFTPMYKEEYAELSFSGSLHSILCPSVSSILLQTTGLHFPFWLHGIFSLFIHLMLDTLVDFLLWLLWPILLSTWQSCHLFDILLVC